MLAPVVIFTYNRVEHTKKMIKSLADNSLAAETEVYIFSDGYKGEKDKDAVLKVREYLKEICTMSRFRKIELIMADKNKGLANSVISGVTQIIDIYGKVIVLEDDLVVTSDFLKFMNEGLNYYQDDAHIWSLSGFTSEIDYLKDYQQDVFFSCRARSWSWATWKDRWNTVDWEVKSYKDFKWDLKARKRFNQGGDDMSAMLDRQQIGVINSWAIRWCYNQFEQGKYNVQPTRSLVKNNGQDGTGTNCNKEKEVTHLENGNNSISFVPFRYEKDIDEALWRRKHVPKIKLFLVMLYMLFYDCRLKYKFGR